VGIPAANTLDPGFPADGQPTRLGWGSMLLERRYSGDAPPAQTSTTTGGGGVERESSRDAAGRVVSRATTRLSLVRILVVGEGQDSACQERFPASNP